MSSSFNRVSRRLVLSLTAISLGAFGLVVGAVAPAQADSAPDPGTPATVTADALPTWQVNGVVWSEAIVGNTVYVAGSFSKARPPGVAQGGAGEINAGNIFAFDIRTGNPVPNFSHTLNAQSMVVRASPDGSRVYVGGDFTTVDGIAKNHIAAFDTATGNLVTSFAAGASGQVRALAVTSTSVYAGGNFQSALGKTRVRLAAYAPSNGALQPWAPTADDNKVWSMVMAPDNSRVIVAGQFTTLSGQSAYGMGSLDASTGAVLPWAANQTIQDAGNDGGIMGLTSDGTQIMGSGWAFGAGSSWEGTWSADPYTGHINWLNDCHGDTYDNFAVGQVLYSVSHSHDCSPVGAFPDTNPRVRFFRAMAWTTYPTGTNTGPDTYGWNYNGLQDSTILHWFPTLKIGSYTGQSQAAWSVTGNSNYVALGGEFPTVNGTSQQGLVRFAVSSIAPNKNGPSTLNAEPSAISLAAGTARVAWGAASDLDNQNLTYAVRRDGTDWVYTTTQKSVSWDEPSMGFVDTGLAPGSTHSYQVLITDPFGNQRWSAKSNTVTIGAGTQSQYNKDVLADGASAYWRLGEPSGANVYDWAGFTDATAQSGVTRGAGGAIIGDSNGASNFDGTANGFAVTNSTIDPPDTFTAEAWFKTTSTQGGKILGYGNANSGTSSSYDRHIYMDNAGRIWFGVYPGGVRTLNTSATYNDGQWHQVVAEMSDAGMQLFVDGVRVGRDVSTTSAQPYTGYWRIGGDNLNGWPNQPSSNFFQGSIDDVAVYPTALPLASVQQHYTDSGRTLAGGQIPTDPYGKAIYQSDPDLYWRVGESSGATAFDSGPSGSNGIYAGGVTKSVTGAIARTNDKAITLNGFDGAVAASSQVNNPTVYSEELWFKTTTNRGGKLIGFGSNQTGFSGSYDRHVYMFDDGRLRFGVWTGQTNVIDTGRAYNDGAWHHLVATQGPDGMNLYVDGANVGSNPQTAAQAYTGYWRVGGDNCWGGNSSNYFAGSIDDVAVYSTELSAAAVASHYAIGTNTVPNQPPTASFTSSTDFLAASFDGSGSSDGDGSVTSYSWNFGDGSGAGSGVSPNHLYGSAGTYHVTLTVTDDKGATGSVTNDVTVVANQAPTAAFSSSTDALSASFDGSGSADADGSIASYSWNFGDGTGLGSGVSPNHLYGSGGTYHVTLTVTDNRGATGSVSHDVTVAPNQAPTAAFGWTSSNLTASFDGSGSSDADGSITSYSWNFGDGSDLGGGVSPNHAFPAPGTYSVVLTVTDNKGAVGSVSHDVTVSGPFAADEFQRTVSGGWGASDVGGTWTRTGAAANYAVTGGLGRITMSNPGSGPLAYLGSVSAQNVDATVDVSLDKAAAGGPIYTSFSVRRTVDGEYFAQARWTVNGGIILDIVKLVGGTQTNMKSLTISGLSVGAGDTLHLRFQATGTSPTTLNAKVWKVGTNEPAGWQVSTTDGAPMLQGPGGVGVRTFLSGTSTNNSVVASFDHMQVVQS